MRPLSSEGLPQDRNAGPSEGLSRGAPCDSLAWVFSGPCSCVVGNSLNLAGGKTSPATHCHAISGAHGPPEPSENPVRYLMFVFFLFPREELGAGGSEPHLEPRSPVSGSMLFPPSCVEPEVSSCAQRSCAALWSAAAVSAACGLLWGMRTSGILTC